MRRNYYFRVLAPTGPLGFYLAGGSKDQERPGTASRPISNVLPSNTRGGISDATFP